MDANTYHPEQRAPHLMLWGAHRHAAALRSRSSSASQRSRRVEQSLFFFASWISPFLSHRGHINTNQRLSHHHLPTTFAASRLIPRHHPRGSGTCLSLHWMQPSLPFPVSLFFLLVRVALKIRSLRIHPPRLCLFAVFFIQTVYKPMIFLCLLSQTDVLSRGILISTSAAQEQDGSHGSAGCRAPDQHQHRRLPLPTKKRWRPSSNLCAPHILSASCTPHFHLPVTECREWP